MTAEARRLAREVTAKSVVLLKNKNLLPLDAGKLRKIAVIGPYSDKIVQDWYSGTPPYETTILSGIRNAVKEGTEVIHAEDNRMGQAEKAAAAADMTVGGHPCDFQVVFEGCVCQDFTHGEHALSAESGYNYFVGHF